MCRSENLTLALVIAAMLATMGPGYAQTAAAGDVRVVGLETNATAEPLGMDDAQPRFTWRLEANLPGVRQTSYRVVVATSERTAARGQGQGLVWDSKVLQSSDPYAIYAGPALASRTRYYWSVRVSAGVQASHHSGTAWFETAYMTPGEWKGEWISGPKRLERPPTAAEGLADDSCCLKANAIPHAAGSVARGEDPQDFCRPPGGRGNSGACREVRPAPMLRKTFEVEPASRRGKVVAARIYSAGLAYNNLTLNGTSASDRLLSPGFTNYADSVLYTTDDVASLIRQGQSSATANVIATQLGSGQFDNETTSGDWGWETAEWRATPRLRLDMYIKYADGTEQVVKSDGSWKVSIAGPTRYDGYYLGETYDARKEIPGWDTPGFDASSWSAAQVVDGPSGTLHAQREEPTKVVATWPAGTRTSPRPGVYVWDTGQQRAGWATISVYGAPAGTPIQIFYSDKTAADGTVSSTGYTPNGQIQTDYYIAKGTGSAGRPEVFAPQFTYKGFQYIQISSPSSPASTSGGTPQPLPSGVTVRVESVQEVRTSMPESGSFTSSNPLLNQIEKYTRAAIAENYVAGIITDTPEYEKNAWTGDAQLSAPAASLMFDTQRQYWKAFQDMADNQVAATGEVTLLAPTNKGYGHVGQTFKSAANGGASPVWDAFWFVIPWESYLRYGDVRGLQTTYPLMQKYLDNWVPQWTNKDGDSYNYTLTAGLGDWCPPTGVDAPDGAPTKVRIPTVIAPTVTAYYAYLTKIAADSARALGRTAEAAHFDQVYASIKTDFNARWWDAGVGYYREGPAQMFVQTMNVLPLAFGLVACRIVTFSRRSASMLAWHSAAHGLS